VEVELGTEWPLRSILDGIPLELHWNFGRGGCGISKRPNGNAFDFCMDLQHGRECPNLRTKFQLKFQWFSQPVTLPTQVDARGGVRSASTHASTNSSNATASSSAVATPGFVESSTQVGLGLSAIRELGKIDRKSLRVQVELIQTQILSKENLDRIYEMGRSESEIIPGAGGGDKVGGRRINWRKKLGEVFETILLHIAVAALAVLVSIISRINSDHRRSQIVSAEVTIRNSGADGESGDKDHVKVSHI
jgi:hypothetical protein